MAKTQRLIEIMMTMNAKRKFTARELAEEFKVSYRTILRDLNELSVMGVPIYSEVGAGGGYYLLQDRMLPPIFFKETEATAMFFAYQSLQFFDSLPFQTETKAALKKFYHYLPEDVKERIDQMRDRVVFWNPTYAQSSHHLEVLLEAAMDQSILTIQYDGKMGITMRRIQPIGLYSYNGFWYCPAYCLQRQAYRLFRADRITQAEISDPDTATLKQVQSQADCEKRALIQNKSGKDKLRYCSIMDWLINSEQNGKNLVPFVVELTRDGTRQAKSILDLVRVVEERSDGTGWIDTRIPRAEIPFYAELVWNLGMEAMAKEPQELISYVREKITKMAEHYR
ncbi:helix-turn-helix transcriptional regulator [Brevibacillus laterosporus]|uniref:helix-turn-helix transcriptional regulator n=1 Tax=Brevibacillus laterosporus TaxID=1465 RepID=UPI000839B9B4|nr:YafY family protein [Brevibacillus laterosporus]